MKKLEIKSNWIDRSIQYLFPVWGASRMHARGKMSLVESFTAGSRKRPSMAEWNPLKTDEDSAQLRERDNIVERSQDSYRNDPTAVGVIDTQVSGVIAAGLRFKSQINRDVLGITYQKAEKLEKQIEAGFNHYAANTEIDITRTLDFYGLQELAFRSMLLSGDVFINMPMFARAGSPYESKIQIIEGARVCNERFQPQKENMKFGVEKDKYGAPTHYHVLKQHPVPCF